MADGLLDLLGGALGTTPPAYLQGLLGENAVEDLRKRSIGSGLVNALIGYAAAPKNQNLGLGRILASAAQSGIQGAQGVYQNATQDYMMQQKINEMKRQQQDREAYSTAAKDIFTPTPAQYETVTQAGGYAPQQSQIAPNQLAPNYGMTRLPDTTTQVMTAPPTQGMNKDALMRLAALDPSKANAFADLYQTMNPVVKPNYQTINNEIIDLSGSAPKVAYTAKDKETDYSTNDRNAVAFANFGTSYSKLSPQQAGAVNKMVDDSNMARAKASATSVNLPPENLGLEKAGVNEVDKALLNQGNRLSQLSQIQLNFRPEYLTTPFKTSQTITALKDKFNIAKPDEKATLTKYAAFRQDSVRQLNDYINEVTGAAIGQGEEANRIKAGVPNVGSGMFDGDSPVEFESKLNNTMKTLRLAEARLAYIKRNGMAITSIKLDEMPNLMRKRKQEIITEKKLDVDKNATQREALKQQLAYEFGLVY